MKIAIPGYTEGKDYVETFDSPLMTREKETRKLVARHAVGENLFEAILLMHGQSGLDASQCSFQAGIYDSLTIVFLRDTSSVIPFTTGNSNNRSYSADANGAEHAIEELEKKYKFCWNHNLYQLVADGSAPAAVPEWAESDKDARHADGVTYLWADAQPSSASDGFGWREVLHRKKKADVFLYPELSVHETSTFRNRASAEAAVAAVGARKVPGKTFGKPNDNKYWLITRSSVSEDGGIFTLQTDYQYSPTGWDPDFYATSS